MRESLRYQINNYPTAEHLLKHKDAVKICVRFLESWGNVDDFTPEDIQVICSEFEQKCYVNSDKWIGEKEDG